MTAFLAIDSSTSYLCLSLVYVDENQQVKQLDFCEDVGRDHAQRMIPEIDLLMSTAGLAKSDLSAIAVGVGPGSYTGVRVAVATGKGLARALTLPLYSYPSLDALAITAITAKDNNSNSNPKVIATMDARRDHVYAASYLLENGKATLTSKIEKISNQDLQARIQAEDLYLIETSKPDVSYFAHQAKEAFEAKQTPETVEAIYL